MLNRALSRFLRIDARSLGLFRIAMGLVLLGDLLRRWPLIPAFYSNEGVLPNHNHIFNLRNKGQVWSLLHAFSSVGENQFAFVLFFLVYLALLLGWKTRVFQALSLIAFVSLCSRNILLENQGNYAAIGLLFFTLFLPLGSRFSVDSLGRSLAAKDEKTAAELNAREPVTQAALEATRGPGYSPMSIAALAVTVQIAIILISSALFHRGGSWTDGTAIYYALHVERWVSELGVALRTTSLGALRGLAWFMVGVEWAVPFLIFVPLMRRLTRGVAIGLLVPYALFLGIFFSLGLYAWTLLAAAALLLPAESWDAFAARFSEARARSIIYDTDCGICLWLSRLVKRLDGHGHLAFQGNDDLEGLFRRKADGTIERVDLVAGITEELTQTSVVVVSASGKVFTRSRAIAEIMSALPLGRPLGLLMRLPLLSHLLDVVYDVVAKRRAAISVLVGMDACGIPARASSEMEDEQGGEQGEQGGHGEDVSDPRTPEVPAALRTTRIVTGALREAFVLFLFVAALAQASKENPFPYAIPQGKWLSAAVAWPRMLERFDVLAAPEAETGVFVVDGLSRKGASIDPLTGAPPAIEPEAFNARKLGQLWNDYLLHVHERVNEPFHRALRNYLGKGGPALKGRPPDEQLSGYDAYWIRYSIAAPGQSPARVETGRDKIFTHSRGGRLAIDRLPLLKPGLRKKD